MTTKTKRLVYVCDRCGGTNVTLDAWAEWSVDEQQWVLGATFDQTYCHDCDQEVHLDERSAHHLFVCAQCGNDDVSRDAVLAWDADKQEWIVKQLLDSFCGHCNQETTLKQRPETDEPCSGTRSNRDVMSDSNGETDFD